MVVGARSAEVLSACVICYLRYTKSRFNIRKDIFRDTERTSWRRCREKRLRTGWLRLPYISCNLIFLFPLGLRWYLLLTLGFRLQYTGSPSQFFLLSCKCMKTEDLCHTLNLDKENLKPRTRGRQKRAYTPFQILDLFIIGKWQIHFFYSNLYSDTYHGLEYY